MFSAQKEAKTIIQQGLSNRNEPRIEAISNCSSVHCSSSVFTRRSIIISKSSCPYVYQKRRRKLPTAERRLAEDKAPPSTYFHTLTSQTNERMKFQFNEISRDTPIDICKLNAINLQEDWCQLTYSLT